MTAGTTYFLTNDGNIYFCGFVEKVNEVDIYEKIPVHQKTDYNFESIHFVIKYKENGLPLGSAVSEGNVFELNHKSIIITKYKTIFDYYTKEHKITDKTVYLSQHIWAEEEAEDIEKELIFKNKFQVMNKLDCGHFGQVYTVKNQMDQKLYAIKSIEFQGNLFRIFLN